MQIHEAQIQMRVEPDQDPDTSYLEEEGEEQRLAAYRRGDFDYCGVRARVELLIPIGGRFMASHIVESPGVWGIETDSGEDYLREVFIAERDILIEMLGALGVTVIPEACEPAPSTSEPEEE